MKRLYFAYGSNLCLPRLRHRVPGVGQVGPARLPGHALRWHKRGSDGSGKCSIQGATGPGADRSAVHGALFEIPDDERPHLDRVEGLGVGYREETIDVVCEGRLWPAWTYVATRSHVDDALRPFRWYRDLVLAGATALDLPAGYLDRIRRVPARLDPDAGRAERNLRFLAGP